MDDATRKGRETNEVEGREGLKKKEGQRGRFGKFFVVSSSSSLSLRSHVPRSPGSYRQLTPTLGLIYSLVIGPPGEARCFSHHFCTAAIRLQEVQGSQRNRPLLF